MPLRFDKPSGYFQLHDPDADQIRVMIEGINETLSEVPDDDPYRASLQSFASLSNALERARRFVILSLDSAAEKLSASSVAMNAAAQAAAAQVPTSGQGFGHGDYKRSVDVSQISVRRMMTRGVSNQVLKETETKAQQVAAYFNTKFDIAVDTLDSDWADYNAPAALHMGDGRTSSRARRAWSASGCRTRSLRRQ